MTKDVLSVDEWDKDDYDYYTGDVETPVPRLSWWYRLKLHLVLWLNRQKRYYAFAKWEYERTHNRGGEK